MSIFDVFGTAPNPRSKVAPKANENADQLRAKFLQAMETKYTQPQFETPQLQGQAGNQFSNEALQMQRNAALGLVPSAAEIQQKRGLERAVQNQLGAANSARGGFYARGAAQQNAANQTSQMQQAGIEQAAQLRAQEMANAQGMFAQSAFSQAGLEQQRNLANLQAQQQGNALNQQGQLATNQLNQQQQFQGLQGQSQAEELRLRAEMGDAQAQAALQASHSQAQGSVFGGILGGVGAGLGFAAMKSDENAKTKKSDGKYEASKFLDALEAHTYEYKPEHVDHNMAPEGKHLGIMAQDLEKTAAGKHMVREMEDGTKIVDTQSPQGYGAILASLSHLNKKLKELEGRGAKNATKKSA